MYDELSKDLLVKIVGLLISKREVGQKVVFMTPFSNDIARRAALCRMIMHIDNSLSLGSVSVFLRSEGVLITDPKSADAIQYLINHFSQEQAFVL